MLFGDDDCPGFPAFYSVNDRKDQIMFANMPLYGDYREDFIDMRWSRTWCGVNTLGKGINKRKRTLYRQLDRIYKWDILGESE